MRDHPARPRPAAAFSALDWIGVVLTVLASATISCSVCGEPPAEPSASPTAPVVEPALDPPTRLPAAPRVVAIGDIHGDLDAARRALTLGGAVDGDDRWVGGDLVLVQTGDVLDRGDDDRALLDLFERLAAAAAAAGGRFLALNGNHEVMNVNADLRYVFPPGFTDFADFPAPQRTLPVRPPPFPADMGGRIAAFAPGGAYARKLARQNVVQLVGDTLFVHGAVLPAHIDYGLDRLNRETRAWMAGEREAPPEVIAAPDAPIWDRRFSLEDEAPDCALLGRVLAAVPARRMVVGHETQRAGINAACDARIWRIDVGLSAFYGGPTEVLEIRGPAVQILREPSAAASAAP